MSAAEPFMSRAVMRPLGWLVVLVTAFTLCTFLFFRSFWQYEIDLATLQKLTGSAILLQQLDSLDIDYRIGKDGTVKVSSRDRERLAEAGIKPMNVQPLPSRIYQAALLVAVIVLAVVTFRMGRTVFALLKQGVFGMSGPDTVEDNATVIAAVSEEKQESASSEFSHGPEREWRGLLENEHPQGIAVYLLGLRSEEAAEALEALREDIRDAVWERMALSGECAPELEQALQVLFSRKYETLQVRKRPSERTEKMVSIFKLLTADTRRLFLAALKKANPEDPLIVLLETESLKKEA